MSEGLNRDNSSRSGSPICSAGLSERLETFDLRKIDRDILFLRMGFLLGGTTVMYQEAVQRSTGKQGEEELLFLRAAFANYSLGAPLADRWRNPHQCPNAKS